MKSSVLRKLPSFQMLDEAALQALVQVAELRSLPKAEVLIRAGEPGAEFFVVLWGALQVLASTAGGEQVTVAVLGGGDPLGEMALFEDAPRSATAVAIEDTELLVIHRDAFTEVLRAHPEMALGLLRMMAARLRRANRDLATLANLDMYGRLIGRLIGLAESRGRQTADGLLIDVALDKEILAGMIGADPEAVAHLLKGLLFDKQIAWRYDRLLVCDLNRLARTIPARGPEESPDAGQQKCGPG